MNIIVTGATGFVGRNIAEEFHNEGIGVTATGRSVAVGAELTNMGIEFKQADIRDLPQLIGAFSPADCVIHCAGRSGPWGKYRDFYEPNVLGTRNVVDACRIHGIDKIVFISSPSVYFSNRDRLNISESDPLPAKQVTNYSRTKLICETELIALREEGFKVVLFRPRALYGPHENTFIPRILRMAEKKKTLLINGGKALIDITCVDNFIDAVRNTLTAPDDAWNETYNISNGDPITVKEWFGQILSIFDKPFRPKNVPESAAKVVAGAMEFVGSLPFIDKEPSMTRFAVGYLAKTMTMSIEKAKEKLNYSPRVGNREGFERYALWRRAAVTEEAQP